MRYTDIYKETNKELVKKADFLSDAAKFVALATVIAVGTTAAVSGWGASKLTSPGAQDKENMQKQHRIARLRRDNQTQLLQEERNKLFDDRQKREQKSMRVFG